MRNEVFNNYVKIALEKGLIKKSEEKEPANTNKDYAETVKALYGLDIKLNDSDKDIIEQAHPEKVIIAPSYDRVNGLVENVRERQDIMVGIVNKRPNGNLTMHRYAECYKDLLNELVALGFRMQNEGKNDLMKLADSCSVKLNEKVEKLVK